MVMADMRKDDDLLEGFFAAARRVAPEPAPAFLERLVAQGEAVQAERLSAAMAPPRARATAQRGGAQRSGVLEALATLVGGWAAMGGVAGGMATAAVAGLWIGFSGAETMLQAVGLNGAVGTEVAATASGSAFLPEADILALAMSE